MPPLLDWLRRVMAGDSCAELVISPEEDQLAGLSLSEVLQAHNQWRDSLTSQLDQALDLLNLADVSRDDLCTLGQWLNGPGSALYGHLPEFADVRRAHREFHLCAGDLLIGCRAGHPVNNLQALDSRLRDASGRNQLELVRLFAASHAGELAKP